MITNHLSRRVVVFLSSILLVFQGACCKQPQTATTRPATVRGWQRWEHFGVRLVGELVLHKGEVSDNGTIGVKLLEIREGKAACSIGSEPVEPYVTLQLYMVRDPDVSCIVTTAAGSRLLQCDERLELGTLAVMAINSSEEWVYIRLG